MQSCIPELQRKRNTSAGRKEGKGTPGCKLLKKKTWQKNKHPRKEQNGVS